jgi:hypothetical protein
LLQSLTLKNENNVKSLLPFFTSLYFIEYKDDLIDKAVEDSFQRLIEKKYFRKIRYSQLFSKNIA